ncbi:hypothetical protein R3W88_024122 [Solanum pinnatisectum]|uniref:Uncharacterized protein n=1 Tax=Solanum pinnatisectum TaxID=50273 RepID=A0AAV9M2P8_9SOLN|nr:hypothetical protein R3W88_024122 [Solanum pinnatisectum]
MLLAKSTKKIHPVKSKFVHPSNLIEIDDDIIETKKGRKRKRNVLGVLSFGKRSVIRGRVVTGFGGNVISELLVLLEAQGWTALFLQETRRRRMGREETREFYVNTVGSTSSISSTICGTLFTLTTEILSTILGVPNREANYLDLTLMELLLSKIQINLPNLILSHIYSLCVQDKKERGLAYGFWLGDVFDYFSVSIKEWQIQTTKDVLGVVDHITIPATKRGANAPIQRLKDSLTAKDKELANLRVAHSAKLDQLRMTHEMERERLIAENCKVNEELVQAQEALANERNINSGDLKSIFDFLSNGSSPSSFLVPPSD